MSKEQNYHQYGLQEERKQFQLERLILFSDAVFAIAITLLVIEIRVPEIENTSQFTPAIKLALYNMLPQFFGFILSFAVIGQFWLTHHKLFGHVTNYNNKLLRLNLLFLFWIVLVPFTSGLNSRYGNVDFVWMVYCLNLFFISLSLILIYKYVGSAKWHLSNFSENKILLKHSITRAVLIACVFLASAVFSIPNNIFFSYLSRFTFFLIPVVISVLNKRLKKQLTKH
ncbi:MAG: DUF1211 domain-containing protein [Bacteroidetes bacterium]|nr:DUF1211 domain-containing protein [Bacteroidota bacterium]